MNPNHRPLILVFLLWVAGLCAAGQFAKIAVPFTEFRALYPGAGDTIGWLLSLISLVGAVAGLAAGALVTRIGLRRMLLGGLILGAALSFWQASLPGFPLFAASRVLEGLSHLAIVIAAPSLIAQACSPRFRGAAMALWSTFFGVAFTVVAWLGLPMVEAFGIPSLFLTHGTLMVVIAGLLTLLLGKGDQRRADSQPSQTPSILAGIGAAIRSPRIAAPGVGWLFYTLTFVALLAVLPERLPADERDTVTGLLPLLGIFVSLTFVPLLAARIGASTVVLIGFGCALLVTLFSGAVPLPVYCLALFTLLGLVQGAGFAAVPELNRTEQDRALSFGLMAQTGNIGNLTGTPLLLFILDRGGEDGLIGSVAVIYGCALAALFLLRRGRNGQEAG